MLANNPDGVNINENCGSTHVDKLAEFVKEGDYDLGLAFDGDADRCLAVDENGDIIDGDKIIAIVAKHFKDEGRLKNNTAVMTVMSNLGFFKFAEKNGITVPKTKVGDRYVLEEMKKGGHCIGGEQSGHIIFLDFASTGDGQLSGVQLIAIMKKTGKKLSELALVMQQFPQVLVNIKTTNDVKAVFMDNTDVKNAIADVENKLGNDGRVLVRASGTEPLIRVMIEGMNQEVITQHAESIADVIRAL